MYYPHENWLKRKVDVRTFESLASLLSAYSFGLFIVSRQPSSLTISASPRYKSPGYVTPRQGELLWCLKYTVGVLVGRLVGLSTKSDSGLMGWLIFGQSLGLSIHEQWRTKARNKSSGRSGMKYLSTSKTIIVCWVYWRCSKEPWRSPYNIAFQTEMESLRIPRFV